MGASRGVVSVESVQRSPDGFAWHTAGVTVLPTPPARLLTVGEYADLGESEYRYELQEGRLVMSPSPTPDHMLVLKRLARQLDDQLPDDFELVPDVDLDLQLADDDRPGWSRRPDLLVVHREAIERVRRDGGLLRADETVIVVEIVSLGSKRTDNVIKRGEYADAGIPHYWIVDTTVPLSLVDCHLAGELGYEDRTVEHLFETTEPFPVQLDLDRLVPGSR
jgi:Uma2 family endonuclease